MIIGHLFLTFGFCSLLFINIRFGSGFLILWIAFFLCGLYLITTEGIEINFNKLQYRGITNFLGFNYGIWRTIPKTESILIHEIIIKQTIGGRSLSSTATANLSEKMITINLCAENRKPLTIYMTKNLELATEIADNFSENFGITIENKVAKD